MKGPRWAAGLELGATNHTLTEESGLRAASIFLCSSICNKHQKPNFYPKLPSTAARSWKGFTSNALPLYPSETSLSIADHLSTTLLAGWRHAPSAENSERSRSKIRVVERRFEG